MVSQDGTTMQRMHRRNSTCALENAVCTKVDLFVDAESIHYQLWHSLPLLPVLLSLVDKMPWQIPPFINRQIDLACLDRLYGHVGLALCAVRTGVGLGCDHQIEASKHKNP